MARDIAGSFNRHYNSELFPLPEPMILGAATRVMSLRDGTVKMSKSDPSDYSRINLMDDIDTLALKIRKSRTDMDPIPESPENLEQRPEARNLINIYAALANLPEAQVCQQFAGAQFAPFKQTLTDLLIATIAPIGDRMRHYLHDKAELDALLRRGSGVANQLAAQHMQEIREVVGLLAL